MSRDACGSWAGWTAAALMVVSVGTAEAEGAGLRVCVAEDNSPFSSSSGAERGIDVDLFEELGRRLGRAVQFDWVRIANRGGLGKALSQSLVKGQCDAFAGIPDGGEVHEDLAEKGLAASTPYLSAAYVLVQAPGQHLASLADLRRVAHLGAVTATPADLYLFESGLHRAPYGNNQDLIRALSRGELEAALMWSPALARLKAVGQPLWPNAVVPEVHFGDEMKTRFVIALRADESSLLAQVNTTLADMQGDGFVRDLARRYGLPQVE